MKMKGFWRRHMCRGSFPFERCMLEDCRNYLITPLHFPHEWFGFTNLARLPLPVDRDYQRGGWCGWWLVRSGPPAAVSLPIQAHCPGTVAGFPHFCGTVTAHHPISSPIQGRSLRGAKERYSPDC